MAKKLLLLDCDGVIFSNELIDEYVRIIDYCASDKYCRYLMALSTKLKGEIDQIKMERPNEESELKAKKEREIDACEELIDDHYYRKDMVLEEGKEEYKNRIDYFKIYTKENAFPGVIEQINEIAGMGLFDDVYIVSHYNSENEFMAKKGFFENNLPNVKVMLMKFHKEPISLLPGDKEKNKKRQRTNKVLEFTSQTGIDDFSRTVLIDDSSTIIDEAEHLKVKHCFYKDKETETRVFLENAVMCAILDSENTKGDEGRGK